MIDRSFGSIYFLPCSNSLLGIATSHIGLIRSLYCSVFKEPSLFKRLDYLTTFVEVCQMIFFEIFFDALSNGAASSATGIILPHCLSCVNCFLKKVLGSGFRVQGSGLWWQLRCNIYRAMPEGKGIAGFTFGISKHCPPDRKRKDFSLTLEMTICGSDVF